MQHSFPQDPIALAATASKVSSIWRNNSNWFSFTAFKGYFDVSHASVLRKCALIIFPFASSSASTNNWQRSVNPLGSDWMKSTPREDINAPDLYIPLMSMLTFVLLSGLNSGLASLAASTSSSNGISADTLYRSISTALVFGVIEVAVLKCGAFFALSSQEASEVGLLDLFAVCGYKFVPIVLCQAVGMLFGRLAMWICFGYACCLALFLFEVRSLRGMFRGSSEAVHLRQKRIYFLFAAAVLQVFCGFLLLKWAKS